METMSADVELAALETNHVRLRGAQRAIRREHRQLVVDYGRRIHANGYIYCFFGHAEARHYRFVLGPVVERLRDVLVIIEPEQGQLITTYRNRDALRSARPRVLPYRSAAADHARAKRRQVD